MILQARTAYPAIMIGGTNYFSKIAPYFLDMTYTDNCDGEKADDLHLQLADRDRRFINDWMPDKGAYMDVEILAERWYSPNAAVLHHDCGRLWIDEIEFELPQHTVSIKATSIPTDAHIKASTETRGWDKTTLQKLADQIAQENKMQLVWKSSYDPKYFRVEQTHESALEFLKHRADEAKLAIKIFRGQVIVYDELQLESAAPQFTIVYGNAAGAGGLATYRMSGAKFTTKLVDTTKKTTVSHVDPASGQMTEGSHTVDDNPAATSDWHMNYAEGTDGDDESDQNGEGDGEDGGGNGSSRRDSVSLLDDPVGSWEKDGSAATSATVLAKAKARGKNKDMIHAEIELSIGCPLVAAGQVFTVVGVGKYDGNWFLESAEHKVGPMYSTKLQARRCLTGY